MKAIAKVAIYLFIVTTAFSQTHDFFDQFVNKGFDCLEKGCKDSTILFLSKAYQINPENKEINVVLGSLYLEKNELEKARIHLNKAIKIDSTSYEGYYNLACLYFKLKNYDVGFEYLEKSFYFGYWDYDWLLNDTDLNEARKQDRFNILLKEYFTKRDIEFARSLNKAREHRSKEQFTKAAQYYEKAAKSKENSLNKSYPLVADAYEMAALQYHTTDLNKKAIACYRRSIKYRNKIQDVGALASTYCLLGNAYKNIGKYNKAIQSHTNSLNLYNILDDTIKIAKEYSSIANIYSDCLGDYTKANINYFEALKLCEQISDTIEIAYLLEMIGYCYGDENEIDKAIDYLEQSLSYYRFTQNDSTIVDILNQLSNLYIQNSDFDKGMSYAFEALKISKDSKYSVGLYESLMLVSITMLVVGIPEKAISYLENAHELLNTIEDSSYYNYSDMLANFVSGIFYATQGDKENCNFHYKRALTAANRIHDDDGLGNFVKGEVYFKNLDFEEALRCYYIALKDPEICTTWISLSTNIHNRIAAIYFFKRNIRKTYRHLNKSLSISEKNNEYLVQIQTLGSLASISMLQKDFKKSEKHLNRAISLYEEMIQYTTDKYKRDIFENYIIFYEYLALVQLVSDRNLDALVTLENSRYKQMKERLLRTNTSININEFEPRDIFLNDNEVLVGFDLLNESNHIINKTSTTFFEYGNPFEDAMGIDTNIINNYKDILLTTLIYKDDNGDLVFNIFSDYADSVYFNNDTPNLSEMVKLFRYYLLYDEFKATETSKTIFKILIEPILPIISGKSRLIIMPDPRISDLPFEALENNEGEFLIEKYDISYVQSYTILNLLQNRKYEHPRKPLIAFGGVNYEMNNQESDTQPENLEQNIKDALFTGLSTRGSLRKFYTSLGYRNFPNIPGSIKEVESISQIINESKIITGNSACESAIKKMSLEGELKKYEMIHFATHGIIVPDYPELSSLVLSYDLYNPDNEDGFLRTSEITELDIDADFVNLSACETGRGKVYSGEGVVGLTQAFMLAGANSVSVSLWPIADDATSYFMTSVYHKIADGIDYAKAINDTKRDFIWGKYGPEYKKLFYWAPFVYYGY